MNTEVKDGRTHFISYFLRHFLSMKCVGYSSSDTFVINSIRVNTDKMDKLCTSMAVVQLIKSLEINKI